MKLRSRLVTALALAVALPAVASAQEAAPLTLEMARTGVSAAQAEARENGWNLTILVLDADAVPIALERMDGASPRTVDFATGKATASIATGLTSGEYTERVAAGTIEEVEGGVTIEGGYPIVINGEIVGGIATSGARPNQDAQAAKAGLDAIMAGL